MKLFKTILFIFLLILIFSSIYFIAFPYKLARLETYVVFKLDELGFDIGNYELKVYDYLSDRKKEKEVEKENLLKPRGAIILKDGTKIAFSNPIYKLMVFKDISAKDLTSLQKELDFVNIDIQKLLKETQDNYITISYKLTPKEARKVNSVLSTYKNYKKNDKYYKPMITQFSGFKRVHTNSGFLVPFLGRTSKVENENNITILKGAEGIEAYYEKELSSSKDIVLNIDLEQQQKLQNEVNTLKTNLDKEQVMSIVLDLDSGYVSSVASSILPANKQNPNIVQYLFDIDFFAEPINQAIKKANISQEDFGLLSKSNLDLKYEINSFIKDGVLKINFMQLVKAYSTFYNNGIIKDFKIANQNTITQKQIIDKITADEIKESLEKFYEKTNDKKLILDFKEYKKTASIKFDYFEENGKRYLKASFMIDK